MTARALAAALLLLQASAAAAASPFPTRQGESGIIDVPDADVAGRGGALFGTEFQYERASGAKNEVGPDTLSLAVGLGRLDAGLAWRQGGRPGDPPPPGTRLFDAALKFQLLPPRQLTPGVAIGAIVDRFNRDATIGGRVIASTSSAERVRLAAYAGGEGGATKLGLTAGLAASFAFTKSLEVAADATTSPQGSLLGGAFRWQPNEVIGFSLGVDWLTKEQSLRVGIGFAVRAGGRRAAKPSPAAVPVARPEEEPEAQKGQVAFLDDRPHFRLKISPFVAGGAGPRHDQLAAYAPRLAPTLRPPVTPAPAAGPSAEDLLESQLKEQEAAAQAREKRLRATEEGLVTRESAAGAGLTRLEAREKGLVSREQHLDQREHQIHARGAVPPAERQLEAQEAQLGSSERQLAAQARGLQPTIEAADGREREALARAQNEHTDYDRLAAQGNAARDRGTQLEWRKQAVGARQRQLAAEETRLVAKGERLDAMERQQRAREDQLDAWQRRLDTRSERLQLVERRAAEQGKPAEAAPAPAAGGVAAGAGGSKDKAVFVMVVKSPTAIMKEQPPKPAGTAEVPAPLHPGVAVEKAVAAATVVYFPTPSAQLSELDREGLENIARLAAREGCEVLVWARAKDPGLMSEASRRSTEIKNLLLKAAPVADKQIVTRITTRPGAQGVDVVVSALRAQPAAAPVPVKADAPAGAPAPALARPPGQELGTGETARRQLREAVQAHQNDIERCIGTELARRRIQSADVLLKLVVGGDGVVRRAEISEGPLAVEEVRSCLGAVAKTWRFPQTGSEYVVDVPITVVAPGKKP